MADALVSIVLEQLVSIVVQEAQQELRQVVGVEKEVEKLTSSLQTIRAALIDAEKRQVTEEVVKLWLEKLRDVSYDMEDVLDDWSTAIIKLQIEGVENSTIPTKKVSSYIPTPCFCFSRVVLHRDIAVKIKELNERVDVIASEKERYNFKSVTNIEEPERQRTTSFIDVSEVCGRDKDKKTIVSKLVCESNLEGGGLHIISIVGMGGIGKTTLAQLAYNDGNVKTHFEKRIWVCVSDPVDEIRIAKTIVEALGGDASKLFELQTLLERIENSILGKKFLIVLDDVWVRNNEKLKPLIQTLKSGAQGSGILVTTRDAGVAVMMGATYMHPLEELSKEVCQSLFSQIAFFGKSRDDRVKLEEIGKKIADQCKGLPLAAKTIGSLMRFKQTLQEWRDVLNSQIWELEEVEKGLFPPLLLSYYDLPSALKPCFSYCATFAKDYVIEIEKLIQLWMAHGYLSSRRGVEMETTGQEYFNNLVMRSFFQDFEKDEDGRIWRCKMHDIVRDCAQFLTKNECFTMEVGVREEPDSAHRKARHLTVILTAETSFSVSVYNRKNLHTLFILTKVTTGIGNTLHDFLHHLKCLRALDLSKNLISELPTEIGKLVHLRYLNLSDNGFETLPETVCDLCNLQTLDLTFCWCLEELPKGMGKLMNLRHFEITWTDKIRFLPKGIGRLSSLRTLHELFVKEGDDAEAFKLGDLAKLNNLKGYLRIRGLANIKEESEARKAELKSKQHLIGLCLEFSPVGVQGTSDDVIEVLQPHPHLEILEIHCYRGTLIPNWVMSLTNLRRLRLCFCRNCVHLPPLGKLPFLESLELKYMESLDKLGVGFLGFGIDDGTRSKEDGANASVTTAFPMLKQLTFHGMNRWKEWDGMNTGRKEENVTIMPRLRCLKIEYCPKLKALPHRLQTMPLEKLEIKFCPILKERCKRGTGEDWSKISHIPNIKIEN